MVMASIHTIMSTTSSCEPPSISQKNVKTFRAAPDLRGRVCTVDAGRRLVDLVQRSCYAGFAIGCDKTQAMRRLPCYSGLELEVARRIVTAARKVVLDHIATLVFCGIATGGCKTPCSACAKGRIVLQKLKKR